MTQYHINDNPQAITAEEAKHLLFYGVTSDQSIAIDDHSRSLDYAIMAMFSLLEEHTVFQREEVEKIFYERLHNIANLTRK